MASAFGGNGLASVLLPRTQQRQVVQGSGKENVIVSSRKISSRACAANVQIRRRAAGRVVVPYRRVEMRSLAEFGGLMMINSVQILSSPFAPSSKAGVSRGVAVVHPYKRLGCERRPSRRLPVSCNARGPVDVGVEERKKVLVNVVDKEMVLRCRTERVESLKDFRDVVNSSTLGDATLTVEQRDMELESSAVSVEAPLSNEIENASFDKMPVSLEGSRDWQLEKDSVLVKLQGSTTSCNNTEENIIESTTSYIVDEKPPRVDAYATKPLFTVDEDIYVQESMLKKSYDSQLKRGPVGVKGEFVSKAQTRMSTSTPLKDAFVGMRKIFAKDGEVVMQWARNVKESLGMNKVIAKDAEAVQGAVSWVKQVGMPSLRKEVTEIVALRLLEDPSAVPSPTPEWPQPKYNGLSGRALLAADLQTLSSYKDHIKEVAGAWRVPLQLSYNPDHVASYFNKRPHVLLFRLLEVAGAFGSVALQMLIDREKISKDECGLRDEAEQLHYTMKSAEALKKMLVDLGPTFIKVAQSLSSRPDLIGNDTAKVLSELQDRLAPYPTEDAKAVIESELGAPISSIFSYLSETPVAAASFGQVYRGQTVDGQEVAVKVQRPDLLYTVARDIYILRLALSLLRKVAGMNSDISVLADEVGAGLFGELDYTLEAANAKLFERAHAGLSYVRVPRTLSHLTKQRVLTMEWIDGFRPLDLQLIARGESLNGEIITATQKREAKLALDSLVSKGVESSLVQLLETGVMHADPHPGNLLYTKDGNLTYLDFGLICRMEKRHQAAMLAAIAHLVNGEWACLANDLGDMDVLKPTTDRFALRLALERVFGEGPDAVVKDGIPDINFGQVTGKLWKIALKFRLRLPPYYTLVLRSLASLEGIAISVDPDHKVFASAYPYVVTRLLTDNSLPTRQVFHSLVLNEKNELRWDRIASIVRSSQGKPSASTGSESTNANGDSSPSPSYGDRKNTAIALLSFALSQKGSCVRRVLVKADSKSLGEGFISASAGPVRKKIANVLSEAFYRSGLDHLNIEQECSTSSSSIPSEDETGSSAETTGSKRDLKKLLFGTADMSPDTLLKSRRLWFLMKVIAGKLKRAPFLTLKVGWTIMTMVCYAAAIAFHRIMVTLSDRLLSPESGAKARRSSQPSAKPVANSQWEPCLSTPALV